jgi:cob(I)alamin adenosyltransferase
MTRMAQKERSGGLVHVITGDGKGKTCSAVGMSARALGRGMKVLLIQFLKPEDGSGEILFLKDREGFESLQFGNAGFLDPEGMRPEDMRLAGLGLEAAEKAVRSGRWDMVILDEILLAADFGLIPVERVLRLIEEKSETVELVLTGRNAAKVVIDRADLVSEIKEIKHPHRRGLRARKGIEF